MDKNIFIAKDYNPDEFAKAKNIATDLGISPMFVSSSLPEFEKKQKELSMTNDIRQLTDSAPLTSEFVSKPENLILSQDSLNELSEYEKTIGRRNESQTINSLVGGAFGLVKDIAQAPALLGYIQRENQKFSNKVSQDINLAPTELVPDVQVTVSEQEAKDTFNYFTNNSAVNYLKEKQNEFTAKAPLLETQITDEIAKGNLANASHALAVQIAGSVPNLLANIGAYAVGGPVVGSLSAFVPTFSQTATEDIQAGIKPDVALNAATYKGMFEVLFENIGTYRIFKNTEKQLVKQLGKEGSKEVIKNSMKMFVNNSFQEFGEEFATSIAQDATSYLTGENKDALKGMFTRAVNSGLVGLGMGGAIGVPGSISAVTKYNGQLKQAEKDAELYSALATKTKLSERSPEAMREYVDKVTEGGPIENTYITREGFKEYAQKTGKSETEIAQEMGLLEEFNKAVETETDIEVKTSKMATDVAKSIHHAELKNDIKFDADKLSVNEAKKQDAETRTQLKEQFDSAMNAMPEEKKASVKESAKAVAQDIIEKLKATDKTGRLETQANADIWENVFTTFGVLTNTDPMELYKKYDVNIRAMNELVDVDMDLNQPGYAEVMPEATIENGEISNVDEFALDRLRKRINESQSGFRAAKINENGETIGTVSGQSTFPELFKNKGLTKDSVLKIIDKYKNKEKLTDNQKETLVDLYNSLVDAENRREYFQKTNPKTFFQSYRGIHTSPGPDGNLKNRLDDLSETLPDIYDIDENTALRYYGFHDKKNDLKVIKIIKSLKGKPEKELKIYRAVPIDVNEINDGDWVSLTKYYAEIHGESRFNGKYKILEKTVKASDLYNAGDIQEWGYHTTKNILNQSKQGSIEILGNKKFNINLFSQSNESTFMHESAHFFLEVMKDLSTEQNARPEMVELFNDVLKTLNVESFDNIGEKEQEIFARSWEAYLMKGEAPSKGLKKAFSQFKTFLINIYKNLVGLEKQADFGINVSDEMKSVFDRMLVAGEEIIQAEKNGPKLLFNEAVLQGLSEEKAQKYIDALDDAREFAESELRAKLMKDVIKKKDADFKAKWDELYNKGTELANSLNEFKVMQTIRENPDLKLSKPLIEKYFPELIAYIPKDLMVTDGGVNTDVVAELFGYPTGYAMLEAIKPYRKGINAFAETYAATKIKEQFPELLESPELSDEAVKAAHNENYRLVKRLELEFLEENFPNVVKDAAGRLIRRMPKTQAVIQQADNIIAQTNVSQIKPHLFLSAEKKNSIEAAKLYKKGEFENAFEAKRKEYLNFELYRAALKAKQDVKDSIKDFKKLFKNDEDMAKRYDMDLIGAARAILAMYGMGQVNKLPSDYIAKIKQYDAESYVTIEALVASVMDGAGNYEQVSYDKFVEMKDAVNALVELARGNKEAEIDGKKMQMETVVDELTGRMAELTPEDKREYYKTATEWENHKDMLMGAAATLKRVESWSLGMGGKFHSYIYQPIADATTKYRLKKIEVLKQYRELLNAHIANQTDIDQPIVATELKFKSKTFVFANKLELVTLLLHTGNESNKSKMLEGYGWGERNQQGQLVSPEWDAFISRMIKEGKLVKADFDFAQGVWDLFESLKPEIQKTHKKLLGFYMKEITANEFTNEFGTYRGGYAPAKTDYSEVTDTKTKEMLEQINSDASMVFPTTGRGATRSRNEAYKAPLSRDINLVGAHIDWALRYAYIEPEVKQIAKMLMNKKFLAAFSDFDKSAIENMLKPWLDRTAKQKVIEPSKDGAWRYVGNVAAFLRRNVNMQIMTFNVVNSLEQFGGLAVATAKVKPKFIKSGLVNYISNGPSMVDDIMVKSDFMRSIAGENIHDINNGINEILVTQSTADKIQDFAKSHVYVLQSATQNVVNTIVFAGAYDQAKSENMSEKEAIRFAESVVRTTQGTNLPEDISKYETGTQTEMLFKTYISYFNMLMNLTGSRVREIQRDVGLKKGADQLFALYLSVLAVPSLVSMALRMGAAGFVDEDDDDFYIDDLLANFFGYQLKTVAATVPLVGQTGVALVNRFATKNKLDDRLSLSPAVSILETSLGVPGAVYEQIVERGELNKKTVKDALTFMGIASSLPIGVLGKPVGYIMDVESGKAKPTGPIDFTRGLVTGKPGSQ